MGGETLLRSGKDKYIKNHEHFLKFGDVCPILLILQSNYKNHNS